MENLNAKRADATDLALDRTRLAHERTMMAWIRTATSLISFGFAVFNE
jgi:putative membrane protein